MLMTILYIPLPDKAAQPKYTPEVCSDSISEKLSADKLAFKTQEVKRYISKIAHLYGKLYKKDSTECLLIF